MSSSWGCRLPSSCAGPCGCGGIGRICCVTGPTGPTGSGVSPTENYLQASFGIPPGATGPVIVSIDDLDGSSITLAPPPTPFINLEAEFTYQAILVGRGVISSSISMLLNGVNLQSVTALAAPAENLINTLIFDTPAAPLFSILSFAVTPGASLRNISIVQVS